MARDGEEYVRIKGTIREIRKESVLFDVGEAVQRGAWIPRSLIHGADDIALNDKFIGEQMVLRMFRWKAEDVGFHTERDDETGDLFNDGEPDF